MATSFLQGILFGLGLSILVGPILFILVQVALERGYRSGLLVVTGVWISDLMYIAAAYLVVSILQVDLLSPDLRFYFAMIGGTALLGISISMFLQKGPDPEIKGEWGGKSLFYFLTLGWSTNTFNPFTIFFWFTVMAANLAERGHNGKAAFFIAGIMLTVMFFDAAKVFAANWVRQFLTPEKILRIRKVSATVIMIFGIWLFIAGFTQ